MDIREGQSLIDQEQLIPRGPKHAESREHSSNLDKIILVTESPISEHYITPEE